MKLKRLEFFRISFAALTISCFTMQSYAQGKTNVQNNNKVTKEIIQKNNRPLADLKNFTNRQENEERGHGLTLGGNEYRRAEIDAVSLEKNKIWKRSNKEVNNSLIKPIEESFNLLKYYESDFIQTVKTNFDQIKDDEVSKGTLYLARPDKIKLKYTQGMNVEFAVTGSIAQYYDIDKDQISKVPIKNTIAPILLAKEIKLEDGNFEIKTLFKRGDELVQLELEPKDIEGEGSFILMFSQNDDKKTRGSIKYILREIIVISPDNATRVSVLFTKPKVNRKISNSKFALSKNLLEKEF